MKKFLVIIILNLLFCNAGFSEIIKMSKCYLIEAKPKAKYTTYKKFNEYHYSKEDWIIDTNRSSIDYIMLSLENKLLYFLLTEDHVYLSIAIFCIFLAL